MVTKPLARNLQQVQLKLCCSIKFSLGPLALLNWRLIPCQVVAKVVFLALDRLLQSSARDSRTSSCRLYIGTQEIGTIQELGHLDGLIHLNHARTTGVATISGVGGFTTDTGSKVPV